MQTSKVCTISTRRELLKFETEGGPGVHSVVCRARDAAYRAQIVADSNRAPRTEKAIGF